MVFSGNITYGEDVGGEGYETILEIKYCVQIKSNQTQDRALRDTVGKGDFS